MAFNYRPAGLSDSSDSDDGVVMTGPQLSTDYDLIFSPPDHYFVPDFMIPPQIPGIVPIRQGYWLQVFVKFNIVYECTFNRIASKLLLTTPSDLTENSHTICYDQFRAHIVFLHNQGLTMPLHFWDYFLNTRGITRHNFISKMSDHMQLCIGCNVLLRWRSGLIDY